MDTHHILDWAYSCRGSNMDENLIPVRMINEFVYCQRLFWLEFVDKEFVDSEDTVNGRFTHRNVDKETFFPEKSKEGKATSLLLSSEKYGIVGKIDLTEIKDGYAIPVEYKSGGVDREGQPWDTDLYQIGCQALLLIENGYKCREAYIYYEKNRKRISVKISDSLLNKTVLIINMARSLLDKEIPEPLVDSPKCVKCSLASICLPDETYLLSGNEIEDVRRLYPARTDAYPMYVTEQGAILGKKNNNITVKIGDNIQIYNIMEISSISLFGNIQISTQLMHELFKRNIPVCYYSMSGWFDGMSISNFNKNGELRLKQYSVHNDEFKSLFIARSIVAGKIKNSRTLIRRNNKTKNPKVLEALNNCIAEAKKAKNTAELLGIEGLAARIYFENFNNLLSPDLDFEFQNRNRRPPKDPLNAMLSYIYSIIVKDITVHIISVGLDPYIGFFHTMKYGKPSLALDLMEEYRSIIGDSVVISLVNNKIIGKNDFIYSGNSVAISGNAKKKFLNYYENRMNTLIKHPVFGYTISYRRTMEVQARLLARVISGELKEYIPMYTR